MNWSVIITVAIAFGLLYAWNMYKNYKRSSEDEKPRLLKIYAGVAVISVLIFVGIKLFFPIDLIKPVDEQQEFQQEFQEDILNR